MMISEINERSAMEYFARLDPLVKPGTVLFVIGGAAVAVLGAKIRVTGDIDVALPFSKLDMSGFAEASQKAGLPVNPVLGYQGAFVELIGPLMLTVPTPNEEAVVLFTGTNLTVKTGSAADLVASKLYRCSEQDYEDIQFLVCAAGVRFEEVVASVSRLPERFRDDVPIRDNLANLKTDMELWKEPRQ
ncbi:MAG: hypothetical protein PHG74_02625 [Kiritimatiellae bacterium]|jgi:hypothetical protein|nr:hypothetical protein [Kiritimatiellia bacterium]MDD3582898.1 hypothetical protein [Kiritimatiellia bacterium]